ncbi:hypothetical protein L2E82_36508 [Cichorium intybus]|uniref:Uncharacterized protein n=1 Tax=Cichorium intybus TaxID=13427 RepID=A0ACB9BRQ9_CICIN|nr:hypothetical protein L2E82_36508 [Cichorium intybus]
MDLLDGKVESWADSEPSNGEEVNALVSNSVKTDSTFKEDYVDVHDSSSSPSRPLGFERGPVGYTSLVFIGNGGEDTTKVPSVSMCVETTDSPYQSSRAAKQAKVKKGNSLASY